MPKGISIHIGLNELDVGHYKSRFALAGCLADAHAMRDLAAAAGFEPHLIVGEQATAQAVIDAIHEAAPRVGSDGILMVTYSGHGSRVRDLGDDPFDIDLHDGWDETWCLYDRQLVDDELYACWDGLKPGARVLVVSDSCFSGGMIRDDERTPAQLVSQNSSLWGTRTLGESEAALRALGVEAGAPPARREVMRGGFPLNRALSDEDSRRVYAHNRTQYDRIQEAVHATPRRPLHADLLLLSAARDNEPAADGDENGVFTAALVKAWNGGAFEGDYVALHAKLFQCLAPHQHPAVTTLRPSEFARQRPFSI